VLSKFRDPKWPVDRVNSRRVAGSIFGHLVVQHKVVAQSCAVLDSRTAGAGEDEKAKSNLAFKQGHLSQVIEKPFSHL